MKKTTEQQIVALFVQAMRTALAILDDQRAASSRLGAHAVRELPAGIYPAKSKYNPFRAYTWNGEKAVYLGMFPSVAACKRAQKSYRSGQQPSEGSRVANARAPLQIVKRGGRMMFINDQAVGFFPANAFQDWACADYFSRVLPC